MRNSQRELFRPVPQHSPYNDWYEVYKSEITDHIKHWPSNRKLEMEGMDSNANEILNPGVLA